MIKNWKYQISIFKTIVDWIVMLYIILPAILIFIFNYLSWWNEIPVWIANIPLFLVFQLTICLYLEWAY
ncbi:hypothetical protein [Niallia sp. Krafla_26]|uniref:hypothetical protein n=1 Tax=Niallia sp. Krafla_26 TaxID=3064703 RepID=UPI003D17144E